MDSIWQQHRTFILKILAGLGVCLVCWIVGASLSGEGVDKTRAKSKTISTRINMNALPAEGDTAAYLDAIEKLRARILFTAERIGDVRQGEELRRGIIEELLDKTNEKSQATRDRFLELSRQSPVACVINLAGRAREYLVTKAGESNVLLVEDIGYDKLQMEPEQIDRYLITLRTIVRVAELAIDAGVFEIKGITINAPPAGRFAAERVFVTEYPVSLELRGSSVSLIEFVRLLNDPKDMVVLRRLDRVSVDTTRKGTLDMLLANMEVSALRIDPEAEIRE
jgi:hypothetical protein